MEKREGDDIELALAAMAERLIEYPSPIVLKVLHRWPEDNEFWPKWAPLKAELDRQVDVARSRRLMDAHANKPVAMPWESTDAQRSKRWSGMAQEERVAEIEQATELARFTPGGAWLARIGETKLARLQPKARGRPQ